jgi:hypothetical protein
VRIVTSDMLAIDKASFTIITLFKPLNHQNS